ncbi:MAG: DUF4339 domain-containing protein [Planctomycetaceae bacterium]|nr:DUF4339 domain-containing protein [Planctomycetaceae bacterium]
MSSQWYYQKRGEAKQGPFTDKELKAKATAGEITPDGFVWKDGLKNWVPAGKVKGLFVATPVPPVPAPPQPTASSDVYGFASDPFADLIALEKRSPAIARPAQSIPPGLTHSLA